jgi:hypothetical protein
MRVILSEEEFKKSWGWHGFNCLEVLWPKWPNLANFFLSTTLHVPQLTNRKTRYLGGDPLDFTQKAQLTCQL